MLGRHLLFFLVLMAVLPAGGAQAVEYRLDECAYTGAAGEVKDSSGAGLHGTARGNNDDGRVTERVNEGKVCSCAGFRWWGYEVDAAPWWYDAEYFIEVPDNDRFSPLAAGREMLISGWFKTTRNRGTIVSKSEEYQVHIQGNKVRLRMFDFWESQFNFAIPINVADGGWHWFAFRVKLDASLGGSKLDVHGYLDGRKELEVLGHNYRRGYPESTPASVLIGAMEWNGRVDDGFFDGNIDEVIVTAGVGGEAAREAEDGGDDAVLAIYTNQCAGRNADGSSRSCPACGGLVAEYRFDECLWSGAAGEVEDAGDHEYHGTAHNGPLTAGDSPAVGGAAAGTCRYGDFDGVDDYISLPGFPDLTGSFTITARIRSRAAAAEMQRDGRIFADDESNSGGYGFSLGDGGAGRLRFFFRRVSPVWLDSGAVINPGTWYFVSAVHDAAARSRTIYVNGNLVATDTYTGTWGSDAGIAGIGGETADAGSEATARWRFGGFIDEVRIYREALDAARILGIYRETGRPCVACAPEVELRFEECAWTGAAGEVEDASGNGHDATARNGAATAADSPGPLADDPGTCRYAVFDGSDDYISIPHDRDLNGTDALTYTAWVNAASWSGTRQIMAKSVHGGGSGRAQMGIFAERGRLKGRAETLDREGDFLEVTTTPPAAGSWFHVALVFAGDCLTLYVDGQDKDHKTFAATKLVQTGDPLEIGRRTLSDQYFFSGRMDEMRVYRRALPAAEIAAVMREGHECPECAGLPDHFAIIHDGTAVTCQGEPVTIVAHDVDREVCADFTGEISLSTSSGRGDWVLRDGDGTLDNGAANDGKAAYTFAAADGGKVIFDLYHREAAEVDIDVAVEDVAEHPDEDPVLVFADAGFVFLGDGAVNGIGTQIAGKPSHLPPGNQLIELQAVTLDTETGACTAALTGVQEIELAVELLAPAAASAVQKVIVDTGGREDAIALNAAGAVNRWTTVKLDFGDAADSTAAFTFTAADAGKLRFHARAEMTAPEAAAALVLAGNSNAINVRPFGFYVYSTTPNAAAASGAASSVFRRAGEEFNLSARAVAWEAGDDNVDENGVPDDDADLADNAATLAYAADGVALAAATLLPAGAATGTLGIRAIDFVGGTAATAAQTLSEVGIVRFTCADSGYLGDTEITITGTSAPIGRFIPDHFAVTANAPELAPFCSGAGSGGGFTYLDQTFGFAVAPELTIIAVNAAGAETVNYRDEFCRLPATLTPAWENNAAGRTLVVNPPRNEADAVALTAAASREVVSFADTFAYAWEETPPFAADFDLVVDVRDADGVRYEDADGVAGSFRLADIGGTELRAGRLWLAANYGPADRDIVASPLTVQYFMDGAWQVHVDDHCTTGITYDTARATTSSSPEIELGAGALTVRHPAAGGPETLRVTATAPAWLLVDDSAAAADFVFGIYRGNDRIIFRREGE